MLTGAAGAGVPFAWAATDEVYGRSSKLREACEKYNKGYVVAVPTDLWRRCGGRTAASRLPVLPARPSVTGWRANRAGI